MPKELSNQAIIDLGEYLIEQTYLPQSLSEAEHQYYQDSLAVLQSSQVPEATRVQTAIDDALIPANIPIPPRLRKK